MSFVYTSLKHIIKPIYGFYINKKNIINFYINSFLFFLTKKNKTSEYFNYVNQKAQTNLGFLENKTAHQKYHLDKPIDVWHICTQMYTFPKLKKLLQKNYPKKKFNTGLDLGCGTVTFMNYIKCNKPILVDMSKDYCNFMQKKGFITICDDIEELHSISNKSQDIIVASDILEHVLNFKKAIKRIREVLKDDGLLLVNIPWEQDIKQLEFIIGSHIRSFNKKNLNIFFKDWNIVDSEVIPQTTKPNGIQTINLIMEKG